jgi:hypothetical protein
MLMSQIIDPRAWWDLHLRKARGEKLSEEEQRLYDAELVRQDREAPALKTDLATLKSLRDDVAAAARTNLDLRRRVAELDEEVRRVEKSLSREAREALGVGE